MFRLCLQGACSKPIQRDLFKDPYHLDPFGYGFGVMASFKVTFTRDGTGSESESGPFRTEPDRFSFILHGTVWNLEPIQEFTHNLSGSGPGQIQTDPNWTDCFADPVWIRLDLFRTGSKRFHVNFWIGSKRFHPNSS